MTTDRLIAEMDEALKFPGVANSWTMPIKARTDMLATGIRTPVGIKLFGNDLEQLDALATEIEAVVREVPGTTSAFAERLTGAYYLEDRKSVVEGKSVSVRVDLGGRRCIKKKKKKKK